MSPRWPIPFVACVLLAAAASGVAQAAMGIRLQTTGDLPFTSDELEQAVGARLAMSAEAGAELVTVGPVDEAGVLVRMGERQVVVSMGTHSGLAAARLVALAIAELAAEAPASAAEEPTESAPPSVVAPPPPGPPSIATPAALAPGANPAQDASVRLSIAFGGEKGTAAAEPYTWTCEAAAAFPRRGFDIVAGLGVWDMPKHDAGQPDEASFVAGIVRAGAGWNAGPVDIVLGPFVAPFRIEGPLVSHKGLLAGAGVMVRAGRRIVAASNVEVFASLRVDAFANRAQIWVLTGPDGFATPRVAASLAIGIGWDLGI
jgi:hypothetical protein